MSGVFDPDAMGRRVVERIRTILDVVLPERREALIATAWARVHPAEARIAELHARVHPEEARIAELHRRVHRGGR